MVRKPDPEGADQSFFLHPVIRHFRDGVQLREFHLLEDLFGEWAAEREHREPLRRFFEDQLEIGGQAAPWLACGVDSS